MNPQYGAEIPPDGPQQDMWAIDTIAGSVHDRRASPADATGGDTETGLGGEAEHDSGPTVYDRIGF